MRIDEVLEVVELMEEEILAEESGSLTPSIPVKRNKRTVTRQFKRYGNKFSRQYRCMSGPRKGRLVTDPQKCGMRKDPKQVRAGKKSSRVRKGERVRKSKLAKRRAPSRKVQWLNKRMRGET
jgi:hypothetical protein